MKFFSKNQGRAVSKHPWLRLFSMISAAAVIFSMAVFSPCAHEDSSLKSAFPNLSLLGDLYENTTPSLPPALRGVSARSAILINADTGDILFRQNEAAKLPMASTTKLMTALIACEALPPDTPVTVTAQAVGVEGSSIYLTEGETLPLESLVYALLLSSANDAAVAIAVAVAGSVDAFADMMNQKATELGLVSTHFVNPHGLDDPEHYTTAADLAKIAQAALKNPTVKEIMGTQRKTIPHRDESSVRLLLNHNKLLRSYEGAIGGKTGFTKKSGRCLVSIACRDGLSLIAVTLNAPDDWRDHTAMLDYGFSMYQRIELCPAGALETPLWVVGGACEYIMVKNTEGFSVSLRRNHGDLRCVVELPRFVYAPIADGQRLGRLVFYEVATDGTYTPIGELPLYAQGGTDAVTYKSSLLEKIAELFGF